MLSKVHVFPSPLDEGLFFANCRDTGDLIGVIACHVDDLLYGGTGDFQLNVIETLCVALEFGTENTGAVTYIGTNVKQHSDKSITSDHVTFASSISPTELPQDHLASKEASLTEEERTQFRAGVGQLNWLSTVSCPELSFQVCQTSSKIKHATVADITSINKVIYKVKKEQAYIHFPTLDLSSIHLRVYSDASFNSLPDRGSQEGYIVLVADYAGKCSPISWSSNRIRRVVCSTLAAER